MNSFINCTKFSLENLENWIYDAMSSEEVTPQEIYDVIKGVVEENYYTHKHQTSKAYELLALLNGSGKGHLEEVKDDCMPPWGHSDMEALRYTDMNNSAKPDNDGSFLLRKIPKTHTEMIAAGYTMTADGFWIRE